MKYLNWVGAIVCTSIAVAGTITGLLYYTSLPGLIIDPPQPAATVTVGIEPATAAQPSDLTMLESLIDARFGTPSITIRDISTGEIVFDYQGERGLVAASTAKVFTAAAALLRLDPDSVLTTNVVADGPTTAVVKAAGDVSLNDAAIADLATQIRKNLPEVSIVLVDTTAWQAPEFLDSWDRRDIDGGFIAPMQPIMLNGGRLGGETGNLARSHQPARDVAKALADELGVQTFGETSAPAAKDAKVIASITSQTLYERLEVMLQDSDNVLAEAIGREVNAQDPAATTLSVLEPILEGNNVRLFDNSGLSLDNRISAKALDAIIYHAATDTPQLRPLLQLLPVAGGSGTLESRYGDATSRGWVRAKTGTLDAVASLAGTIQARSGRVYSFAMICNDTDVMSARAGMDELATVVYENG